MTSNERDDFLFDFSEQVLGESVNEKAQQSHSDIKKPELNYQSEVQTSYLLVNALMNLLIQKGIIYPHEVQHLIAELHMQYMKRKGRDSDGDS